jgi:hypothetical protein
VLNLVVLSSQPSIPFLKRPMSQWPFSGAIGGPGHPSLFQLSKNSVDPDRAQRPLPVVVGGGSQYISTLCKQSTQLQFSVAIAFGLAFSISHFIIF